MKKSLLFILIIFIICAACKNKKIISPEIANTATFTPQAGVSTNTATPTKTNTQISTGVPTMQVTPIDDFEDGDVNLTLRGAAWSTWQQGSGSNANKQPVSDAAIGNYACRFYGDVVGTAWSSISLITDLNSSGTKEDHTQTDGLRLYMKGNKGTGTGVDFLIMLRTSNITDYSYWRYRWTPIANWTYVQIPWSSFTAPSWGEGAGKTLTEIRQNIYGIQWVITDTTGSSASNTGNQWFLDHIEIYKEGTPGPSPTPTFTSTPTVTTTPCVWDADNPNIQYFGRWDFTDIRNPVANWGPVYIKAKFEGTSITIRLIDEQISLGAEGTGNYYQYSIDGGAFTVLPSTFATTYVLATGLADTTHTLTFMRRSESKYGKTIFSGFILDTGKNIVAPDPRPSRKIEVLGDSISSGLAIENTGWYTNATNNGYKTFGAKLAEMVNAEFHIEARGGGTFYSDTWLPMREFFKRTFGPYNLEHNPSPSNPYWDFNSWKPDVFFLELGTNDFSEQYPHIDQTLYVNKYKEFLTYLRSIYPDTYICCIPPFKEGTPWDEPRAYIPIAVSQMADAKIHCVSLYGLLIHPTDYVTGDEYHPNEGGHTKIANYLYTNYIQPIVGW